jgi:hypothetical protein
MKKSDFEAQGLLEVGMDKIIAQTKEARMAGVRENNLMDLLLSRHVSLNESKGGGSASIIAPFTLVPRRSVVNANYFAIEGGTRGIDPGFDSGHAVTGVAEYNYEITVNIGISDWKSPLVNIEKYFLPGTSILIENLDSSSNAQSVQMKIISVVNANAGTTEKAKVLLEPNVTSTTFAAYSSAQQGVFHPTAGVVQMLANSVSDYESWCYQPPTVNNTQLVEYWSQTHRWTHCYNDEYMKALQAPLTSEFFKKFRMLPLAQQRKQQELLNEQQFFNTVFYGQEINENQTVEGYTSLPQVTDPADSTCALEFKSNTLGVRTQLDRCGMVKDKQGAALNLDEIFEAAYTMKRHREMTSGTIDTIDCMTDRFTASKVRDLMIKYYKDKYSADISLFVEVGQKVTDSVTGKVVLEYNKYDLPDQGVSIAVFTHPYFDDRLGAFASGIASRGRAFWMIDWSDVDINLIKTNSAKRQTNTADDLYNCVIQPNVKHYQLNSKTFEVRVGDTNRHNVIENFSDACPTLTVAGCNLA